LIHSTLPLVRLRVIDEESERNGRAILTCEDASKPIGELESRFGCGKCEAILVVGSKERVGNVLYRCLCGAVNELPGAAGGRSIGRRDPRRFFSDGSS
jgi:hypothetical protein